MNQAGQGGKGESVWRGTMRAERGTRRVRLLSSPARSSRDSNICRKNGTDRAGRLHYTCADISVARCRDDAEHQRSTGEAIAGRSTWLREWAHIW